MLEIIDNKIIDIKKIYDEIISCSFKYGEVDHKEQQIPTGLISEININAPVYHEIVSFCKNHETVKNLIVTRSYVNLFPPREVCSFHIDHDDPTAKTFIYYPHVEYNTEMGGETKFLYDNATCSSVLPIPGRIIIFNSNMPHSATSFHTHYRFSLVIKFERGKEYAN